MAPVICCCSTLSQFSVESRYYSRVCCCGGWWSVCLAGGCLAAHCLLATLPFALSSATHYFPWRRQPAESYSFWHGSRSLWLPFWRCCTASLDFSRIVLPSCISRLPNAGCTSRQELRGASRRTQPDFATWR